MRIPNRFLQSTLKLIFTTNIFCLSCLSVAQTTPAADPAAPSVVPVVAPEKPIYANNTERDNDLLAKAFTAIAKADELQWLETPSEKVLSLYKAGETRKTKGVLLIMHAPEVPQLWPTMLENLRRNLPLYSWATMALPLPAKYSIVIPQREAAAPSAKDPATETPKAAEPTTPVNPAVTAPEAPKPVIARDQLITERVDAAVTQLNKIGQFNLAVMVDNSSAPDALATLYKKINKTTTTSDTIDGPLQALILVNLQDQEPLSKEQLSGIFAVGDLPVMDVFFNPDTKAQLELRRMHQAEAMRQNIKDYQQLILPTQSVVSVEDTQSFWLGKIHGFVTTKAEGNEFSKKGKPASTNVDMK